MKLAFCMSPWRPWEGVDNGAGVIDRVVSVGGEPVPEKLSLVPLNRVLATNSESWSKMLPRVAVDAHSSRRKSAPALLNAIRDVDQASPSCRLSLTKMPPAGTPAAVLAPMVLTTRVNELFVPATEPSRRR